MTRSHQRRSPRRKRVHPPPTPMPTRQMMLTKRRKRVMKGPRKRKSRILRTQTQKFNLITIAAGSPFKRESLATNKALPSTTIIRYLMMMMMMMIVAA